MNRAGRPERQHIDFGQTDRRLGTNRSWGREWRRFARPLARRPDQTLHYRKQPCRGQRHWNPEPPMIVPAVGSASDLHATMCRTTDTVLCADTVDPVSVAGHVAMPSTRCITTALLVVCVARVTVFVLASNQPRATRGVPPVTLRHRHYLLKMQSERRPTWTTV